jgi:signal transduction histidine kinase
MPTETLASPLASLSEVQILSYQRLAALGSLAAAAAHEFNNLMTPVLARAQHALLSGDEQATRRALECTAQQTQRAMSVTRQLLEMADGRSGGRGRTGHCRVAESVQNAFTALARPLDRDGIDLTVRVPHDQSVRAEPILFEQVLVNLLLNARNAMKAAGGRIIIESQQDQDLAVIDVRDTGVGIRNPKLRAIREFLRGERIAEEPTDWQSIGLGLYTCRTIVRHFNASIDVLRNEGRGCTFRLHWPAA